MKSEKRALVEEKFSAYVQRRCRRRRRRHRYDYTLYNRIEAVLFLSMCVCVWYNKYEQDVSLKFSTINPLGKLWWIVNLCWNWRQSHVNIYAINGKGLNWLQAGIFVSIWTVLLTDHYIFVYLTVKYFLMILRVYSFNALLLDIYKNKWSATTNGNRINPARFLIHTNFNIPYHFFSTPKIQ